MVRVTFKYKDVYSNGKWREQSCTATSIKECKEFYGLGIDPTCEYRILKVEEV